MLFLIVESDRDISSANPINCPLKLTNKHPTHDMLFRIQTTSPLSYRVRPSHGRIALGESMEVHVGLVADSKKQDKFLIRYVPVARGENNTDFMQLFTQLEVNIKEHRLKCMIKENAPSSSLPNATPLTRSTSRTNSTIEESLPLNTSSSIAPMSQAEGEAKKREKEIIMPSIMTSSNERGMGMGSGNGMTNPEVERLQYKIQELNKQIDDLKKALLNKKSGGPPEWITLLNNELGFPPVLVILIALCSFLIGMLLF